VGSGNARRAVIRFAEHNCTCSIITSDPIYTAICGREMVLRSDKPPAKKNTDTDKKILALRNLKAMERHLMKVASATAIYDTTTNNVTAGDKQLRLPNAAQKSPSEEAYMEPISMADETEVG